MKYIVLFAFSLLSACAGAIDAPSLAPRPAETADIDTPAPAPAPPQPADAAQAALIAKLVALAKQGDAAFEKVLPATITSGAPQSEAWIAAQSARSAAESARGPTLDALSGLDTAIGEAIDKGQDTGALAAARTEVQTIYDRQAARLDAISR
jgi:hypothetical protein